MISSDHLHLDAYNKTFADLKLDLRVDQDIINSLSIDSYLLNNVSDPELIYKIKQTKKKYMLSSSDEIQLIKDSHLLIDFIQKNNINHCVVTNTSKPIVDHFKKKNAILNKLDNWITREDYINAKPNPECYELAVTRHGKDEKYVIGFENTLVGYNALCKITPIVYLVSSNNNDNFQTTDAYIIENFSNL